MVLVLLGMLLSTMSHADTIRVAVVDTGLNLKDPRFSKHLCPTGHKDFTDYGIEDHDGHGTHVAGLIQQYAKNADYCLLILKYYDGRNKLGSANRLSSALWYAALMQVKIVNFSGYGDQPHSGEKEAIKKNENIIFSVSAGNDSKDIDSLENAVYPACYRLPNIHVVGNGIDGIPNKYSNYGSRVTYWENGENVVSTGLNGKMVRMTGTSQATAIHTGKLIYGRFK